MVVLLIAGLLAGGASVMGTWLMKSASRLRRGFAERSAATAASAFTPLRRYFITLLVLQLLGLIVWTA